ncbi:TPA: 50S ribosomal protein L23 [Candidatus Collierbacteria bacterium]|uniref:Large ribosomal subunit protein uL23 n=1 Tax=Candidatus Collierbacteria bacterium GW2011_GWB2_44_22 TaxID=1618387 RepID=A0A0G1KWT9_9BACT|nr:MAG: 50S ribosomal protein L23 [Candidatus Collierbacteria bacterium GW2011_GWA2_44_13]KKT51393.1 MAG: 50S ribosomal protein L23 [Candidatus Collierbacteria bacterium GW2011_GWB1_44_197]KKT52399.1 MAG: 50S ribosomal protein L23 [Candidatus Collierbacteria bacterium GW2011_GWB2_44_22]KKT62851.1 MAG: 50S ribosomal protein L23 [Candidatus Collierbacteria bacterium GW2011_GWD1_44_27]KKT66250.1 MAG: 50S ribosomal protein L23 [Candidatus Collierbacteria bacterium GW2011_GWC2_44_30]KKT69301.1 MAG:
MSTPLVHQNTIIKPVVTEKSYSLAAMDKYVFKVDPAASKYQIKKAIEDLFKVDVLGINTVKHASRTIRSSKTGRHISLPVDKKAIIRIKKGQKIEIFNAAKP